MAVKARLPFLLLCFLFLASLSMSFAWRWNQNDEPKNPFHFNSQLFQTRYSSEVGHISLLQKFDKDNRILGGIKNYRLLDFKAVPQTFVLPHITDADYIIYVVSGRLLFTIMYADHTESYKLGRDDVLILPAGALAYVANLDDKETFRVMHLVIPINIPGEFTDVFPGVQQKPPSFYSGFSTQTLEAAFNSAYQDILEDLLGEKKDHKDVLVQISRDKIEELSRDAKSSLETGQSKSGPFNLTNIQNPFSNDYGKFWEAHPNQVPQLQEFDVAVTLTELNQASLLLPHLNSKGWLVAYITHGDGLLEIAAPWREEEDAEKYGEIGGLSSQLSEGDAFVIPPGYPFAVTASNNVKNLRILGFEINSQKNKRIFLAVVEDNVITQIPDVAKGLIFNGSDDRVKTRLEKQEESYFARA